jgi:hypothetical protein
MRISGRRCKKHSPVGPPLSFPEGQLVLLHVEVVLKPQYESPVSSKIAAMVELDSSNGLHRLYYA